MGSVSQHLLHEGDLGYDQAGHRGEIQPMQQAGMRGRQAEQDSQQRCAEKYHHRRDDRIHRGASIPPPKIFTMDASNVSRPGGTWRPMVPSTRTLIPTAALVKMRHCLPNAVPASPGAPSVIRNT